MTTIHLLPLGRLNCKGMSHASRCALSDVWEIPRDQFVIALNEVKLLYAEEINRVPYTQADPELTQQVQFQAQVSVKLRLLGTVHIALQLEADSGKLQSMSFANSSALRGLSDPSNHPNFPVCQCHQTSVVAHQKEKSSVAFHGREEIASASSWRTFGDLIVVNAVSQKLRGSDA